MKVTFEITDHISTLSTGSTSSLELNEVSFNGYPPRFDIRRWATSPDGEKVPLRGISLWPKEVEALKAALERM